MDRPSVELEDNIEQEGCSETPQNKKGGEENGGEVDVVPPFMVGYV